MVERDKPATTLKPFAPASTLPERQGRNGRDGKAEGGLPADLSRSLIHEMELIMSDERNEMLKAAIAKCFKAREPVSVANVKAKLPEDFFLDFDTGKPLADIEAFKEIQAAFSTVPKPRQLIDTNPDGHKIIPMVEPVEDFSGDESLRDEWAPETVSMPVIEAAPVAKESTANHVASGPGQSPQARLNAARRREQELLGHRPLLLAAQRNAREALAVAVRTYQEHDPHRQTHKDLAREFCRASQAQRAAKARGEAWATPPERKARGEVAYVDLERQYSQGGDANAMARRMNRTGNRRGAYPKSALGQVNRDPSRGPVPAPVVTKPTIPALGK